MIRQTWEDHFYGRGFGRCCYKVYESTADLSRWQTKSRPWLVVWLHGMDHGFISPEELETMQRRLNRRVVFMVPLNPKEWNGLHFNWGCAFTREQNKKELGFVNGFLHDEFLTTFAATIANVAQWYKAERTVAMGYSMGGFGAFQLGCWAPDTFDAVVSVAGYGLGTNSKDAPQPYSGRVFWNFLEYEATAMAKIPVVLAIHARNDRLSSFGDVDHIISTVDGRARKDGESCVAKLVTMPTWMANSDNPRKRKRKSNHGYFNCTFMDDYSNQYLWNELQQLLDENTQGQGDWQPHHQSRKRKKRWHDESRWSGHDENHFGTHQEWV